MKMNDGWARAANGPLQGSWAGMLRKSEYLFHVLVCVVMMNAFVPFVRSRLGIHPGPLDGDPFQRTVLIAAYSLALLALCFHVKKILFMIAATPAVWLLLLWATLSVLWSGFPEIAFRRVLAVWLTSLYGLVLYLRFEFKQLLRLLGVALLVAMAGSLVLLAFSPEWAVMGPPLPGTWRGAFIHKNHLGRFSALALLVWGHLLFMDKRIAGKMVWGSALIIGVITLIGSQSLSALVIGAIIFVSALFFKMLLKWKKLMPLWLILLFLISGTMVFLFVENHELILYEGFNKKDTLSGRIPLWQNLGEKISQQPLLGYGYGTFWLGTEGPAAVIWKNLEWGVTHAHNGYLDLWLQLGLPGIGLALYLLLRIFFMSLAYFIKTGGNGRFWPLFMIFFICYNLMESVLLVANGLLWVVLVYVYIDLKFDRSPSACQNARSACTVG